MYAIVATGGKQYRVEPGSIIEIDRIADEVGGNVTLDQVLLVSDKDIQVGTPTVGGASVTAKVVEHFKGKKIITYKYKRRQRSRRRVGSRHQHTRIEIVSIDA